MRSFALVCLLFAAHGADIKQKVNPVEKVVELLSKLQAEVEHEGQQEAAAYDKYACFCKEQASDKQYSIEKFTKEIEVLDAKIEDKAARKVVVDADISNLNTEIEGLEGDQEVADGARSTENGAYVTRQTDYGTGISAMDRAITSLQGSKDDMKGATAGYTMLSQYSKDVRDSMALAKSLNLLQNTGGPSGYSYHSNEIVATMNDLKKDFRGRSAENDDSELETKQAYQMSSGARRNNIKGLQKSKSEKSQMSNKLESELNAHSTEQQETTAAKAADGNFLADLTTTCETKATDWDARGAQRGNELTAMAGALELLKGKVSEMYPKNLGLLNTKKAKPAKTLMLETAVEVPENTVDDDSADAELDDPVSFLQLRRPKTDGLAQRRKVIGFLTDKASTLKSKILSTLLFKMKSAPTPFAKVKQMIVDLVDRLESEANSEGSKKDWCDGELSTSTANRDAAQIAVESLNALHAEKTANSAQLMQQIADLGTEVASLQAALKKETDARDTEHLLNQQAVTDATAGEAAITSAIDILNAFYNPTFLQTGRWVDPNAGSDGQTVADAAPEELASSSKTDASKSIISMMDQIKEDFTNTITSTEADEAAALEAFTNIKGDTQVSIDGKTELKGTKDTERQDSDIAISTAEDDLKRENELLQTALDELTELQPACVESGASWEERTARRNQEIDALKSALKIFQNTDFGF